jgi:hypothetical protein
MSSKPIVIALLVTILLAAGVIVVFLSGGKGRDTDAGPVVTIGDAILEFDQATVTKIAVSAEGRAADVLEKLPDGTQWAMKLRDGNAETVWRADFLRVRAFLRELAGTRAVGKPAIGETIATTPPPTVVTLTFADGGERTLKFAARTLGGQARVEITDPKASAGSAASRMAVVPDSLSSMVSSGVRAWRDTQLVPGAVAGASRLRMTSGPVSVQLNKVQGRWGLTEPVIAPAAGPAIDRTLKAIESLQVARFLERPVPSKEAGFETPSFSATLEFDTRTIDDKNVASVSTVKRTIVVGGPADASGENLYVSVDGGPAVAVKATSLLQISMDLNKLVAPASVQLAPDDVGAIAVAIDSGVRKAFKRGPQGWTELVDGQEVLLDKERAAEVQSLATFVCNTPALRISQDQPAGVTKFGTIKVGKIGASGAEELTLFKPDSPGLVVKAGEVYRVFDGPPAALAGMMGP